MIINLGDKKMSLKKTFSSDGKKCTVVFTLNAEAAAGSEKVYLAGTSKEFLNTLAQEITECASTKYGYNKLEIEVI